MIVMSHNHPVSACSLFIGNEFFITDNPVIATPLGANDVRHGNSQTVSHRSSKRLSLNSLFLRSLGDQDGIAPLVINTLFFLVIIFHIF